jgi:hypothetical protein
VQFEFKLETFTRRHLERSRFSGGVKDLACGATAVLTKPHHHHAATSSSSGEAVSLRTG